MIVFFVGTPGSGKSYEAVKKIVDNLKMGRVVCTNIDGMDQPKAQEYIKNLVGLSDYQFNKLFRFLRIDHTNEIDEVRNFWKTEKVLQPVTAFDPGNDIFEDIVNEVEECICPPGSLIVIDEAHKFFNARDWQDKNNRELADWASTHRHMGYDLVLITQDIGKVEKQVRSLTEWTYFFRKVNFFGSAVKNKYLCYSYSGDDHNGTPLSKNTRTYEASIFPCYQSYSTKDAKEVGFMSHSNILKHPVFYAIPVLLAFVLYMFFAKSSFARGDVFGVTKVQHKFDNVQTKGQTQTAALPSTGAIPVQVSMSSSKIPQQGFPASAGFPVEVSEYSTYKIDGYIQDGQKTYISINGHSFQVPSPHVKSWSKDTHIAVAKTSIFGEQVRMSRSVSNPSVSSSNVDEVQEKTWEPFFNDEE